MMTWGEEEKVEKDEEDVLEEGCSEEAAIFSSPSPLLSTLLLLLLPRTLSQSASPSIPHSPPASALPGSPAV